MLLDSERTQEQCAKEFRQSLERLNGEAVTPFQVQAQSTAVRETENRARPSISVSPGMGQEELGKLKRENRRLQAELSELKQHNGKLAEELGYKSKLLLNKSKDLTRNNERLVELEQELALYKLESMATPSKVTQDLPGPEFRHRALSENNISNIFAGARNASEVSAKQSQDTLQREISDLRSHRSELMAAVGQTEKRLDELVKAKSVVDTRLQHRSFIQKKDKELISVLALSTQHRKRSLELQKELVALRESVRAKNEHLAVLRKQMAERESDSILSDSEGFLVKEEKASHTELLELEEKLHDKEQEYEQVLGELGEITAQLEEAGKPSDSSAGRIVSRSVLARMASAKDSSRAIEDPEMVRQQVEEEKSRIDAEIRQDSHRVELFRVCKEEQETLGKNIEDLDVTIHEKEKALESYMMQQQIPRIPADLNVKAGICTVQNLLCDVVQGFVGKEEVAKVMSMPGHTAESSTEERLSWVQEALKSLIQYQSAKTAFPRSPSAPAAPMVPALKEALASANQELQKLNEKNTALESKLSKKAKKCKDLKQTIAELTQIVESYKKLQGLAPVPAEDSMDIRFEACMANKEKSQTRRTISVLPRQTVGAAKDRFQVTASNTAKPESVLKRIIKLARFVADRPEAVPALEQIKAKHWEFLDKFSKQMRVYIRRAEGERLRVKELRQTKGKFLGYVEKEVSELTKSWNLMEEEKAKLTGMLREIVAKQEAGEKELSEKAAKLKGELGSLEKEIADLTRKRDSLVSSVSALEPAKSAEYNKLVCEVESIRTELAGLGLAKTKTVAELQRAKQEIERTQQELAELQEARQAGERRLQELQEKERETTECIQQLELNRRELDERLMSEHRIKQSTETEVGEEVKQLEQINQLDSIIEEKEKILTTINSEVKSHAAEADKYKEKVEKYKVKLEALKKEIAQLQTFSDTHTLTYYYFDTNTRQRQIATTYV